MARQYKLRWKMPFQTFMGEQLEVQIEQDGWTGGVTTISDEGTGGKMFAAARPFETKGQTDSDIFKPIRTQSGYIRVVCKDESWRDLIPEDNEQNFVKLVRMSTGAILWMGYMRAESFKHTLYEYADTVEFPLICPLSILENKFISATNTATSTFREVLEDVFTSIGRHESQRYEFHSTFSNEIFLDSQISRMRWLETNDNKTSVSDNTFTNTSSCFEILEQYCEAWGFTCEMHGDHVTFSATDFTPSHVIYSFTLYELRDLNYYSRDIYNIRPITETIADAKSMEEIIPPVASISVETDMSPLTFSIGIPSIKDFIKNRFYIRNYIGEYSASRTVYGVEDTPEFYLWRCTYRMPNATYIFYETDYPD